MLNQSSDVQVYTPNANQTQAAFFSQPMRTIILKQCMSLFAVRGVSLERPMAYRRNQPVHAELVVTIPQITQTIFLRGAQTTG
jgi:hypothetical protein